VIQPTTSHPISLRSLSILSTHLSLGLPSGLFPSGFHTKYPTYVPLFHTQVLHVMPISSSFTCSI
jgi:hypothetical protein